MVGAAAGSAVGYSVGTAITRSWEAKLVKEHFGMSASKNALKYSETTFGPGYLFKESSISPRSWSLRAGNGHWATRIFRELHTKGDEQ